jgi:hypothetical protein
MKTIEELVRGEKAAVESINAIMNKLDETERSQLQGIKQDHVRAVEKLEPFVNQPTDAASSGPWGTFSKSFTGTASLFGDKVALQALKAGEEWGIKDYKQALEEEQLQPQVKELIRNELLPKTEEHVRIIDRFLQ